MQRISYLLLIMALLCCVVFAQSPGPERSVLPGTCVSMEIVEVEASGSTIIYPYWPRTKLTVEPAEGVSEKFRVTVATSTIDTDLPMKTSFTANVKGSCFFAVQTATNTAKLLISQFQE